MRLVAVDVLARYQPQEVRTSIHLYINPVSYNIGQAIIIYMYTSQTSDARLINSILPPGTNVGNGTVIINCNIQTPVTRIGANCFLSGLTESFSELQVRYSYR